MTIIPATILQQFIGMDDYEKRLAIDRIARELGLTPAVVEDEINAFEKGGFSPENNLVNTEIPEKKTNFTNS